MSFLTSSVGKKYLTGITGISLVLFTITHLAANLTLLQPDGVAFNKYAYTLMSLGPLLYVAEIALLTIFIVHAVIGIWIYFGKRRARPVEYEVYKSSGKGSRQSLSSRTMLVTGMVLLVFMVFHLMTFKFGPGIAEGYTATLPGVDEPVRDLHLLVIQTFQKLPYVIGYTLVMLLFGFHLRHGVWSALQSLGANRPSYSGLVYTVAAAFGLLLAIGFLFIPLWIYFFVDVPGVVAG